METITPYQFEAMSYESRCNAVACYGLFLGELRDEHVLFLYNVKGVFVEIKFDPDRVVETTTIKAITTNKLDWWLDRLTLTIDGISSNHLI